MDQAQTSTLDKKLTKVATYGLRRNFHKIVGKGSNPFATTINIINSNIFVDCVDKKMYNNGK